MNLYPSIMNERWQQELEEERMKQELEEERMMRSLAVLQRVERGLATPDDVAFLAAELGLSTVYQQEKRDALARQGRE